MSAHWCCGFCGKLGEVAPVAPGVPIYAAPLPEGWAWEKYDSARLPGLDSRALGCCPEHAKLAADKFRIPPEMKPAGF
jgi:hypothetical protein